MLGPFIDTIVVCTLTAVVILLSGAYLEAESNGILMTLIAFEKSLFGYGDVLLMLLVAAWCVTRLALFGSTVRDMAREGSDIDILIGFDRLRDVRERVIAGRGNQFGLRQTRRIHPGGQQIAAQQAGSGEQA